MESERSRDGAAGGSREFRIEGMTCGSCVGRIEKAVGQVPGVRQVRVNLATGRASVEVGASGIEDGAVEDAVKAAGYRAYPTGDEETPGEAEGGEARELLADLRVAVILTVPLVVMEMGGHLVPAFHATLHGWLGHQGLYGTLFALATLVLVGPGRRFFRTGVPRLLAGEPDMTSLVALGTGAAWAYSSAVVFLPDLVPAGADHVYFESSAVVVTLVLLGKVLEAATKGRASAAIRKLAELRPPTARRLGASGFEAVPLGDVQVGDLLQIRPGEPVPVDGAVVEGESRLDESMLTGEPAPRLRTLGDEVVGGTRNTTGTLVIRATRVGKETVLARILRSVTEAQAARLPVQEAVDRVTRIFVPAVLAVAALTFVAWMTFGPEPALPMAVATSVAVLLIACPCAMGLATPMSVLVGSGRAAELGILFRKGEALQKLGEADLVAFDKTGTLTVGKPTMVDHALAEGFELREVLRLAASVEGPSEHPLAGAVVAAAQNADLALASAEGFAAVPGRGVRGRVEGREVLVGSAAHLEDAGIRTRSLEEARVRMAKAGRTPILVAVDGRLAGVLAIEDTIAPGARETVAALGRLGIEVAMITGDDHRVAESVARRLGIGRVLAEILPEGKLEAIRSLRRAGRRVAFVGDGLNDAPALAAADVGVAVGTGTGAALEAAEVVLVRGSLDAIGDAIRLSRATLGNIRTSLAWAFGYNVLLVPVATGALASTLGISLTPVLASLAMALSSTLVVANALRLRDFGVAGTAEGGLA